MSTTPQTKKRDGFKTSLGVLTATLGSAVGLGNIWKFPYMTGEHGGAVFLLVYLLATLFVGLPVMISEITLGRHARANAVSTFRKLSPKGQPWGLIGFSGVLAAFLIMAFYTDVVGWIYAYIFKAVTGQLTSVDPAVQQKIFGDMVADPIGGLLWQWVVLALIGYIAMGGVAKGIERTTRKLMPVLLVLLIAVCIRSLTLPDASKGLAFLFTPDLSKISGSVVLMAMGLAFFKLSIGMGTMLTYGSYFRSDQNIPMTATRVMLADLIISLLAGIAIFPAVFSFGFEPGAGPSLLFITIPAVFASMPFGSIFIVLFFVLAAVASLGAMLSLLEVPIAYLAEAHHIHRKKATLITVIGLGIAGSGAVLSSNVLKDFLIFGMNLFDLYDYLSSNVLMPVGGIAICLFTACIFGYDRIKEEISNKGALPMNTVVNGLYILAKFVTPLLIAIILLKGIGVF